MDEENTSEQDERAARSESLRVAASMGDADAVRAILRPMGSGASVEVDGAAALLSAARAPGPNCADIIRQLLDAGADPEAFGAMDTSRLTAIQWAAKGLDEPAFDVLLGVSDLARERPGGLSLRDWVDQKVFAPVSSDSARARAARLRDKVASELERREIDGCARLGAQSPPSKRM